MENNDPLIKNAREFLQKGYFLGIIVKDMQDTYESLEENRYDAFPAGDSDHAPKPAAAGYVIDLKNHLTKTRSQLAKEQDEILRVIEKVSDLRIRTLLTKKYIGFKSLDLAAEEMHYSPRHIQRLHKKGIELVAQLLKQSESESLAHGGKETPRFEKDKRPLI